MPEIGFTPAGLHQTLPEEHAHGGHRLIGDVLADCALACLRVIRLAYAREQEQPRVVVRERAGNHERCGLLDVIALDVHICHARRFLFAAVQVDAQHVAVRSQFEQRHLFQRGQDVDVRRCLRVVVAGEARTETAEVARTHLAAILVRVGLRDIRGWFLKRMKTHFTRGEFEQVRSVRRLLRRQREVVRAVCFERITHAVRNNLTFHAIRLARRSHHLFDEIEVRFQLFVSYAEVLQRHAVWHELAAVLFLVVRLETKLFRIHAPMLAGPVQARAAHAFTRFEGANLPIRQRGVVQGMAEREARLRHVLEQLPALQIGQLIERLRIRAVRVGVAIRATLQCNHVQAGFGQFLRHDGAGPAEADDHGVHGLHL
jgi:hypothetical protein